MPLYRVDIQKSYEGEFWTNTYILNKSSIDAANNEALSLVDNEEAIHLTGVGINKMRVSSLVEGDNEFIVTPLARSGQRNPDNSNFLPLYVTAVVLLGTGVGRVGRKYYRGVLAEKDINFNVTTEGVRLDMNAFIASILAAGLHKANGTLYTVGAFPIEPGMRQLRRGSKRRQNPVI